MQDGRFCDLVHIKQCFAGPLHKIEVQRWWWVFEQNKRAIAVEKSLPSNLWQQQQQQQQEKDSLGAEARIRTGAFAIRFISGNVLPRHFIELELKCRDDGEFSSRMIKQLWRNRFLLVSNNKKGDSIEVQKLGHGQGLLWFGSSQAMFCKMSLHIFEFRRWLWVFEQIN